MTIHPHTACTRCGCVCDDLILHVRNDRIERAELACVLADDWFLKQNTMSRPMAEIAGSPADLSDAVEHALDLLRASKAPLIYGLSRSTTEGQRAAVELAEKIGAIIDTTASLEHAQSLMALQQVGESTCTLGEVKTRADLIIYWGSNPVKSHPRHLERYAMPEGVKRQLVVIDVKETETSKLADTFIRVEPGQDWEVLWKLRMLIKGLSVSDPDSTLVGLASRMNAAKFGVIFFGNGLTLKTLDHRTVEALLQLVTDLNSHSRFYARRMRVLGDVAGADSVLTWTTGYPFAVNMQRGFPRYNPMEFGAPELLAKGQVDLCLMIGSETARNFPAASLETLNRIPVITLDATEAEAPVSQAVRFTTATYGIHHPGTAYRMDEIPIPLRSILKTKYPTDAQILRKLIDGN